MAMDSDNLKQQIEAIPIPSELRQRGRIGIEQAKREQRAKRFSRGWAAVAVVFAFILLSTALVNHTKVWAAIQNALQFVPGMGMVKEEESSQERYVLSKPITLKVGEEGSIVITGILSDDEMTYITMTGKNTPRIESVTLIHAQGSATTFERSMALAAPGQWWTASFWHKGKLDVKGDLTLIIPQEPDIKVPIRLSAAKSVATYSDLGPTSTVNGLSITAVTDRVDREARVSLVSPSEQNYRILDYGILGVNNHEESRKLHVVDEAGNNLDIRYVEGLSSPRSEFYFPLSVTNDGSYKLTLPEISVAYNDEVTVKVPTDTNDHLNQTFEIAGYPVTITKVEKTSATTLRLYTDLHYDEQARSSLYEFSAKESGMARLNEQTGEIVYMECTIKPGSTHLNLHIIRPYVVIRGPWEFHFNAEDFAG